MEFTTTIWKPSHRHKSHLCLSFGFIEYYYISPVTVFFLILGFVYTCFGELVLMCLWFVLHSCESFMWFVFACKHENMYHSKVWKYVSFKSVRVSIGDGERRKQGSWSTCVNTHVDFMCPNTHMLSHTHTHGLHVS